MGPAKMGSGAYDLDQSAGRDPEGGVIQRVRWKRPKAQPGIEGPRFEVRRTDAKLNTSCATVSKGAENGSYQEPAEALPLDFWEQVDMEVRWVVLKIRVEHELRVVADLNEPVLERDRRLYKRILRGDARQPLTSVSPDERAGINGRDNVAGNPFAHAHDVGELGLEAHIRSGIDVRKQIIVAEPTGRVLPARTRLDAYLVDMRQISRLVETNGIHDSRSPRVDGIAITARACGKKHAWWCVLPELA